MKLGYVCTSKPEKNPEIAKMKQLGVEKIFIDQQTESNSERPQYHAMKQTIRAGDVLILDTLFRLGSDCNGIVHEWKEITQTLDADIIVLEAEDLFNSQKFRNSGVVGKLMEELFLSLLSYIAEQERNQFRIQRQNEGIHLALSQGRKYGGPGRPKLLITPEFIKAYTRWRAGEITAVTACKLCNMNRSTFYLKVKEYESTLHK